MTSDNNESKKKDLNKSLSLFGIVKMAKKKKKSIRKRQSSGCLELNQEPERFPPYIIYDKKARENVLDEDSFYKVFEKVLRSDPTLRNIVDEIKSTGNSFRDCAKAVFDTKDIQDLIKKNIQRKRAQVRKKLKQDRPKLRGKAYKKELERRVAIAIGVTKVRPPKQITLPQVFKPIHVKYTSKGKTVQYRKSKHRSLSSSEKMLIKNNIRKNPREIIQIYRDAGLKYRTDESLRKHIWRIKSKKKR